MKKLSTEEFINRCKEKYGDRYDYSKTVYNGKRNKITITCPEHGDVEVYPSNFLNASNIGCPECGKIYASTFSKGNKEEFIAKAIKRFGDKYSFPYDDYINNKTPIHIHCNVCGNDFQKRPNDFLLSEKGGCTKCSIIDRMIDFNEFNKECLKIYGEKYEYIPFEGKKKYNEVITFKCPKHGIVHERIRTFLKGKGCRYCLNLKNDEKIAIDKDIFLKKSDELYGDKFTINIEKYKNRTQPIEMICKECGHSFKRIPYVHLSSYKECPNCLKIKRIAEKTKSNEYFISQCKDKYGDEYSYDKTFYTKSSEKVTIKHNKCGRYFTIEANSFLNGNHGCPYHYLNHSKTEEEIAKYIHSLIPNEEIRTNDRVVLDGQELDIYIPSLNIAFEYDGIFWHSELFKDKTYHLEKTIACEHKNIRLIHIFEDEWLNKINIWKSLIKNLLKCEKNHIFARKCKIIEVDYKTAKEFLGKNHLQGNCPSSIRYGLEYEGELVSLMTFGKSRHFVGNGKSEYELLRFANKLNTVIVGGASKLFKHFINQNTPQEIISYADRRWSQGNLYKVLGFNKYNESKPNYYYIINNERKNRFGFRKTVLIEKYNCPDNISEREFCYQQKWYRIYDCGCLCYKWNR